MPAVSKKQQKFMGIVHGLQKGTVKPSNVSKKAQKVAKDIKPSAATDFASTKHKGLPTKVKHENKIGEIYGVKKPGKDATLEGLMFELNPFEGLAPHGIPTEEVHGIYADQKEAQKVAEALYSEYEAKMQALEEKKNTVADKITKAIEEFEAKRKEHVDAAKADPKNASAHKEKIAHLATKIDDLMTKLEKVERSKKEKEEDTKDKKVVKESINEADEPGSPERLMLTIKNPLIALINAAKKAVEVSGEEPYLSNKETDNAVDNLALLVNLCYMFLPEKSNNLRDVRSIKLALAKAADQKMGTPPAIPSKAPIVPNVTGKSNLGGKPPLPPLPTGKTAAKPPLPPMPKK